VLDFRSYLGVNRWALERMAADPCPSGYARRGDAVVATSSVVADSARFVGPVWVGPGCRIDERVLIVGPTAIGEGALIESDAVVTRSVGWDRCRVGPGAVVDQCVLAADAMVEAECVVRNTVCMTPRRPPRGWLRSWGRRGRTRCGGADVPWGVDTTDRSFWPRRS
jgi:mannose-1-phosphate guanylyltransferase